MTHEYLKQFNPMQAGKIRKALERQVGLNMIFKTRAEHALDLARSGCVCDDTKERVWKDASKSTFFTYQDVTTAMVDYIKFLQGPPQCSICRDYHPNDDRHPCE